MPWPNQFWPNAEWAAGAAAGSPPTAPAIKVFSFNSPTGPVGSTVFLPFDFFPRLLLLFGNGRDEIVNTVGQRTLWQCYGAATPADQFCSFGMIRDTDPDNRVKQGFRDDAVFAAFEDSDTGPQKGRLKVATWGSTGILLEVDEQFDGGHRICAIGIGGALQAKILTIAEPATVSEVTYTGVGFKPDQAFFLTTEVEAPNTSRGDRMNTSIGVVASPAEQVWIASMGTTQGANYGGHGGSRPGNCVRGIDPGANDGDAVGSLTQFIPDGFKINWTARARARLYIAILMTGNYQVQLDTFQTPAGGGTVSATGMSAPPDAVLLLGGGKNSETTGITNAAHHGAFQAIDNRWALSNGVQRHVTGILEPKTAIRFNAPYLRINTSGVIINQMDVQSIDAGGFTLVNEVFDGLLRFFYTWSWVDIGTGAPPVPPAACLEVDPGLVVLSHDLDWQSGVRERSGFLTDVLRSYSDAEQRIQLRRHPRMELDFNLILSEKRETALMDAVLWGWQGNRFAVPLWMDLVRINAPVALGATTISLTTTFRRFVVGGRLLLWRDPHTYELLVIDTVSASSVGVTTPTAQAWADDGRTWAIPVMIGRLPDQQAVEELADFGGRLDLKLELEFLAGLEPAAGSPTQYQGYDVLEIEPDGPRRHTPTRNRFRFDNRTGVLYTLDRSKRPILQREEFIWLLDGRSEVEEFQQFLFARKGALIPFWVPTWQHDLILDADVGSSDTVITIKGTGYASLMFPHTARRHLAFLLNDGSGTKIYRDVIDAVPGGATETITVAAPPGIALPKASTKISFLALCRLAVDDPEMLWHTTEIAETRLGFIELPAEAP